MLKEIKYLCLSVMVLLSINTFAQKEKKYAREGNKLYEKSNFKDAEISYRKAIAENKNFHPAYYNLANALYNLGKYSDADSIYNLFNSNIQDPTLKAFAYHNIGNSLFHQQKYAESIEAYKKSLRINPKDAETKYNLAKAQQMLQQQQQQQQQQQNKDDKNKQNQDNKDQQNQEQQQNKDKEDNKQQNNQNKKQISKEEAERILNALDNNDKKTQEKVKEQNQRNQNTNNIEKDW